MKVFISYAPQQSRENLHKDQYEPVGNERLRFRETRFPILTALNGYAEAGETVRMVVIQQDNDNCRANTEVLREELDALCEEKGIKADFRVIPVPFDDDVSTHIATFQKLIDHISDGDELYACLTYGSKPSPIAELMALRFARMAKKNVFIRCIVYGKRDWISGRVQVYDETALAQLDDLIRVLAESGEDNIKDALDRIIAL